MFGNTSDVVDDNGEIRYDYISVYLILIYYYRDKFNGTGSFIPPPPRLSGSLKYSFEYNDLFREYERVCDSIFLYLC